MHHKLVTARLIESKRKLGETCEVDKLGKDKGFDDSKFKASTTSADHVPLSLSLSQVVNMELGSDPEAAALDPKKSKNKKEKNAPTPQMSLSRKTVSEVPPKVAKIQEPPRPTPVLETPTSAHLANLLRQQQQFQSSFQLQQLRQMQAAMFLFQQTGATPMVPSLGYLDSLIRSQQSQALNVASTSPALTPAVRLPEVTPSLPVVQQQQQRQEQAPQETQKKRSRPEAPLVVEQKKPQNECEPKSKKPKPGPEAIPSSSSQPKEDEKDEEDYDEDELGHRFRPYQYEQWTEKFQELCNFRKVKGHCQVPHTYKENPPLARWVKRQRYQYKLKSEGKQSTMTDERVQLLENIGFIWDSHAAAWAEKLQELKEYYRDKGDCNVPSTHPQNAQLATWVKCQRRQYKLLRDGKTSNMTLERIVELEKIGFVWEVRKSNG